MSIKKGRKHNPSLKPIAAPEAQLRLSFSSSDKPCIFLILNIIRDKGQVTRQTAIEELRISRATAGRLLAELETDGAILRKGAGKGIYYVLPLKPPA